MCPQQPVMGPPAVPHKSSPQSSTLFL